MATWHDMAEAFVGDMTTRTKTKEHEDKEKIAEAAIIKNAPIHLTQMLQNVYQQFDARATREAAFVKAIDKIEPNFHLHFLSTKEKDYSKHLDLGWTKEQYRAHREPYVSQFPLIQKFDTMLFKKSNETNFFPKA